MKTSDILIELQDMMDKWGNPVEAPINEAFVDSITKRKPDSLATPMLKKLGDELCFLLVNQPDYFTFLKTMDGFEYNGLILYSLSVPEPLDKNLFVMNDFYRDNDDFINPDLAQRLVIGNDSISLFTYDNKTNLFEIRDNAATENVFGVFDNFNEFLIEVVGTVK
ncbi:YrhA family protein [Pantoea sp. SS70]|uniref:YrhA family protein n=1 Tax=Pantoea sp. SS70 TaxID=3024247 RepID=UPI0024535DCC|nr:YrhA family protein [Pantoea sp. SS70]WGK58976.1 YrhA family protein [Pantoea sp. SS70]